MENQQNQNQDKEQNKAQEQNPQAVAMLVCF